MTHTNVNVYPIGAMITGIQTRICHIGACILRVMHRNGNVVAVPGGWGIPR